MISNWLKSNRKKILVHGLILGGFLLCLLFLAVPFFDKLEAILGESKIQQLSLPHVTGGIRYNIDNISVTSHSLEVQGWGFIEQQGSKDSRIYIVIKSDKNTYAFDTCRTRREDISDLFRKLDMDIWSGFLGRIPLRKIESGEYIVGFYITKGDIKALQYTDTAIVKYMGHVNVTVRTSKLQKISLPAELKDIRFSIDSLKKVAKGGKQFIGIAGWALIEGQSSENNRIYLVLQSDENTYVFDTILQKKPGVTKTFAQSGLNLDKSRFIARIPQKDVAQGTYKLGIYIEPFKVLHFTEKVIELK